MAGPLPNGLHDLNAAPWLRRATPTGKAFKTNRMLESMTAAFKMHYNKRERSQKYKQYSKTADDSSVGFDTKEIDGEMEGPIW